ncbi:hypothetical protein HOLleu_31935 [Holothuria leucospilota]|uniref:Tyr recombinase domain-containing protein n=1 Tax=Holothuria leucospilota TaxID=206669 RepID=A0A9Q0YUE7_HOLLE|nr:hypothetical protein HOLleu_31935 [Holothuria leucospilota]
MILALISAQRVQALSFLHMDHMKMGTNLVTFQFHDLLKQNKPENLSPTLLIRGYPPDRRLCAVKYLRHYVEETSTIRGAERYLLTSYKKPFKRVTAQTVSRWLKEVMKALGINTDVYKAHSTRAAATSAASTSAVSIQDIMAQARRSNERTFRTYYNKPVTPTKDLSRSSALYIMYIHGRPQKKIQGGAKFFSRANFFHGKYFTPRKEFRCFFFHTVLTKAWPRICQGGGAKPIDRLSALRATMGWRGAQENFGPKCFPDRWKWHFQGLFTAYKKGKHKQYRKYKL